MPGYIPPDEELRKICILIRQSIRGNTMTVNYCLCLLRFQSLPRQQHDSETSMAAAELVLAIEAETDSKVPRSTTQALWQVERFDFETIIESTDKVILIGNNYEEKLADVIFLCAAKKAVAVLITKQERQLPGTTAAVPIFQLEPDIFNRISENQWAVSFEVLRWPFLATETGRSSITEEHVPSKAGGTKAEKSAPSDFSLCDNASKRIIAGAGILTDKRKQLGLKVLAGIAIHVIGCFDRKLVHHTGKVPKVEAEPKGNWTLEQLYTEVRCNHDSSCLRTYPSREYEASLRRWVNDNKLPQDVGDRLLHFGVRDIDDIALLMQSSDAFFTDLAVFDNWKLRQAIRKHTRDESVGSSCRDKSKSQKLNNGNVNLSGIEFDFFDKLRTLQYVLGLGFAVMAVRAATRMHGCRVRDRASSGRTLHCDLIFLASLIRSIWFTLPNLGALPSETLATVHRLDKNNEIAGGGFTVNGSLAVFSIITFVLLDFLCSFGKHLSLRQGRRPLFVTFCMVAPVAVDAWLVCLHSQGFVSVHGMLFAEAATFGATSMMAACWVNIISVQLLTVFLLHGASIGAKQSQAVARVSGLCNFFFYSQGILDTVSALIVFVDWNAHDRATEIPLEAWLDICYVSKFLCELTVVTMLIQNRNYDDRCNNRIVVSGSVSRFPITFPAERPANNPPGKRRRIMNSMKKERPSCSSKPSIKSERRHSSTSLMNTTTNPSPDPGGASHSMTKEETGVQSTKLGYRPTSTSPLCIIAVTSRGPGAASNFNKSQTPREPFTTVERRHVNTSMMFRSMNPGFNPNVESHSMKFRTTSCSSGPHVTPKIHRINTSFISTPAADQTFVTSRSMNIDTPNPSAKPESNHLNSSLMYSSKNLGVATHSMKAEKPKCSNEPSTKSEGDQINECTTTNSSFDPEVKSFLDPFTSHTSTANMPTIAAKSAREDALTENELRFVCSTTMVSPALSDRIRKSSLYSGSFHTIFYPDFETIRPSKCLADAVLFYFLEKRLSPMMDGIELFSTYHFTLWSRNEDIGNPFLKDESSRGECRLQRLFRGQQGTNVYLSPFQKKFWMIPLNVDNSHWQLLLILNPTKNEQKIMLFDSLQSRKGASSNESQVQSFATHFLKTALEHCSGPQQLRMSRVIDARDYWVNVVPTQQRNAFDCGIFVILFAIHASMAFDELNDARHGHDFTHWFSADNGSAYREILRGELISDFISLARSRNTADNM